MLTASEINNANSLEAQGKLSLRVQDAALEDQKLANAAYRDSLIAQAKIAPNKKQQLWMDLYALHLRARKDPAVVSSTTSDAIVKDIVLDAVMMTAEVFPQVRAAMSALEVPPGGVDWE